MNRHIPSAGQNPQASNRARRSERKLDRRIRETVHIRSSRGRIARKRKKYVTRTERANYKALVIAVMRDLAAKHVVAA